MLEEAPEIGLLIVTVTLDLVLTTSLIFNIYSSYGAGAHPVATSGLANDLEPSPKM
jgi:hypothetical protein